MTRSKSERSESLEVRIAFVQTKLRGVKGRAYQRILQQLLRAWLEGGDLPEGFSFDISWRNPDNRNPNHADWKTVRVGGDEADDDGAVDDARTTLNKGGWLSSSVGSMAFARAGKNRRRRNDDDEG